MVKVKPWVARLYPERHSSLYVRVQCWATKKAFLAHVNTEHVAPHGRGYGRRCSGTCSREDRTLFRRGRPARKSPCVAEVNLWRGKIGIEVITHELFHVTMAWAARRKLTIGSITEADGATPLEERLCYVHGELCRQFMVRGLQPGGVYHDGAYTAKPA